MFLEFTLFNDNKVLININLISGIYQGNDTVFICVGNMEFHIKESYNEVIEAINNYYELPNA